MEDISFIHKAIEYCGLGSIIKEPVRLYGGFLHKNYNVQTLDGDYVIKLLNPEIMKREDVNENLNRAEKLEMVLEKQALPIVGALAFHQRKRQLIDGQYFYLFKYFKGNALAFKEIKKHHCVLIGTTLAKIHQLKMINEPIKINKIVIDWNNYTMESNKITKLLEWSSRCEVALPALKSICHHDLDPKNVLWNKDEFRIIDLECLDMGSPYVELLETALCWAGYEEEFKRDLFETFIKAYYSVYSLPKIDWKDIYNSNFKNKLEWLAYNLSREKMANKEEQIIGQQEVYKTWKNLCVYASLEKDLLASLMVLT